MRKLSKQGKNKRGNVKGKKKKEMEDATRREGTKKKQERREGRREGQKEGRIVVGLC